jgi:hypothetical protein
VHPTGCLVTTANCCLVFATQITVCTDLWCSLHLPPSSDYCAAVSGLTCARVPRTPPLLLVSLRRCLRGQACAAALARPCVGSAHAAATTQQQQHTKTDKVNRCCATPIGYRWLQLLLHCLCLTLQPRVLAGQCKSCVYVLLAALSCEWCQW